MRLAIVDDNKEIRLLMRAAFATSHFMVVGEAATGIEAIGMVVETRPDVVLMDIEMPAMDGIEATRHLTRQFPNIPIFGFTGSPGVDRDAMVEAGAVAVFEKSNLADLLDALDEWAANHLACQASEHPPQ